MDASAKKNLRDYFVLTYVIIWVLLGFTGAAIVVKGCVRADAAVMRWRIRRIVSAEGHWRLLRAHIGYTPSG